MTFQRLFCLLTSFTVGKIFTWSLGIQPVCLSLLVSNKVLFVMGNSVELIFKKLAANDSSRGI